MRKPRFAGLGGVMRGQADIPTAAARSGAAPGTEPDEDEDHECEADASEDEDEDMTDTKKKPACADDQPGTAAVETTPDQTASDPVSLARAEERQRISDVFASEHVAGREKAAAKLLATSDMSASAIVAVLPDLTPAAAASDDGAAMLAAMRENANADLGQGGEPQVEANHGWGDIHAEVQKDRQR